jgi:hypothetical protein
VGFSSIRESSLFGIFGVVRQLDAELADSLCCEYPQVAAAVVVFPQGYHTGFAAARAKARLNKLVRSASNPITLPLAVPVCFPSPKL